MLYSLQFHVENNHRALTTEQLLVVSLLSLKKSVQKNTSKIFTVKNAYKRLQKFFKIQGV